MPFVFVWIAMCKTRFQTEFAQGFYTIYLCEFIKLFR